MGFGPNDWKTSTFIHHQTTGGDGPLPNYLTLPNYYWSLTTQLLSGPDRRGSKPAAARRRRAPLSCWPNSQPVGAGCWRWHSGGMYSIGVQLQYVLNKHIYIYHIYIIIYIYIYDILYVICIYIYTLYNAIRITGFTDTFTDIYFNITNCCALGTEWKPNTWITSGFRWV